MDDMIRRRPKPLSREEQAIQKIRLAVLAAAPERRAEVIEALVHHFPPSMVGRVSRKLADLIQREEHVHV